MDKHKLSHLKSILKEHSLFAAFDDKIIEEIINSAQVKVFKPNDIIIQEGNVSEAAFYLLLEGQAQGVKYDNTKHKIVINQILVGNVFGEGVMFGEQTREISVHAVSQTKVLVITQALINKLCDKDLLTQLLCKLHSHTISYLSNANNRLMSLIDLQKNVGFFLINIVVFLSLFSIAVTKLSYLLNSITALWVTLVIIATGVLFLISRLVVRKIPVEFIGITTKNLKRSLIEATVISIIIIVLGLILKIVIIKYTHFFPNGRLFFTSQQRSLVLKGIYRTNAEQAWMVIAYFIHSMFQEILARGSMQTTFKYFFTFKYNNFAAIVLASLVFAAAHSFFGIAAVVAVFFPGLLWGWMFERQGNIFGAALSHALIGTFFLQFVGPF